MFPSLKQHGDWALLFLRLAIGAIFIYHGWSKWSIEEPNTIMTILKFAEPLGGAAMILGVLSQLAGLGLSIIMIGATYMKMSGFGQGAFDPMGTFVTVTGPGWAYDLIILAGCIVVVFMGAGKISVDGMMKK